MKWFVGYDTSIERYNAVNTVAWNPIGRIDGSRLDHLRADQISNLDGLPFIQHAEHKFAQSAHKFKDLVAQMTCVVSLHHISR